MSLTGPHKEGNYYLQVSGRVVGNTAGSFGGAVMLAPVLEPETYGMMLDGLGVLSVDANHCCKYATKFYASIKDQ